MEIREKTTEELLRLLENQRHLSEYEVILTNKQRLEIIGELHSRGVLMDMSEKELIGLLRSVLPVAGEREALFRVAEELSPIATPFLCEKWGKCFPSSELVSKFNNNMIANTDSAILDAIELFSVLRKRGNAELLTVERGFARKNLDAYYTLKEENSGIYAYVYALLNKNPEKQVILAALEYLCQGED